MAVEGWMGWLAELTGSCKPGKAGRAGTHLTSFKGWTLRSGNTRTRDFSPPVLSCPDSLSLVHTQKRSLAHSVTHLRTSRCKGARARTVPPSVRDCTQAGTDTRTHPRMQRRRQHSVSTQARSPKQRTTQMVVDLPPQPRTPRSRAARVFPACTRALACNLTSLTTVAKLIFDHGPVPKIK